MKIIMLPALICFGLFFSVVNSVVADSPKVNSPASLNHYLPESCYQTGRYTQQKSIAGMTKLLETEGSFAFACDKGLLWHTAEPLNETLIYQLQGAAELVRADGSHQKLSGTVQRHLGQMLNNLLSGNSAYVEKTFDVVTTETGVRLTPRKKRMEKFLRRIDISRSSDSVTLRMQHQGEEFTAIRVYQLQPLASLTASQCTQLLATASLAIACQQLFGP